MSILPRLHLGAYRFLNGSNASGQAHVPAHHLVTHGCLVGMTGSGKTGLLTVMIEEALRADVPVLVIDIKGDLPNLLLRFPELTPELLVPWLDGHAAPADTRSPLDRAAALAEPIARA